MFLIDDDEPEVFQRREDRAARADDDASFSITDAVPLVVTLTFAEMAMQHRHLDPQRGKARSEALDGLRSEGDLRDEDQSCSSPVNHLGNRAQIHLRLTAACDPLEHNRTVFGRIAQGGPDVLQRLDLFVAQLRRCARHEFLRSTRRAAHGLRGDIHPTPASQSFQRGIGGSCFTSQLGYRHRMLRLLQIFHCRRLARRFFAQRIDFLLAHLAGKSHEAALQRGVASLPHRTGQNAAQSILLVAPVVFRHPLGQAHEHRRHLRPLVKHRSKRPHTFRGGGVRHRHHSGQHLPVAQRYSHP